MRKLWGGTALEREIRRINSCEFYEEDRFNGCQHLLKKKDEQRATYKSGGQSIQVDYVMCRRRDLKEMYDCKAMVKECVAKQHRMVVCKIKKKDRKSKAKDKMVETEGDKLSRSV